MKWFSNFYVSRSKHDKLMRENIRLMDEIDYLRLRESYSIRELNREREKNRESIRRHNRLVERINALGGEDLFRNAEKNLNFTSDDLKILISLCHPDRHGGKESATKITAKLLGMRK